MTLLALFAGAAVGALITGVCAMNTWSDGYDAAKNIYSDWHKGYKQGYRDGISEALHKMEDDLK